MKHSLTALAMLAVGVCTAGPGVAQMKQISTHIGEMSVEMDAEDFGDGGLETLRFEPWQMLEEMFRRDDVVYLMRHGPTDWNKLDIKNVSPTDCANQRVMDADGKRDMQRMGFILAENEIRPSRIVVSEWCRNQETMQNLMAGFETSLPGSLDEVAVETSPDLNLLFSLQGAPNVSALRETISAWDGGDGTGPLMLISHFTNIEELTEFSVYEGEVLVIDPKRDNRVIGYFRLSNAEPDVGHFRN